MRDYYDILEFEDVDHLFAVICLYRKIKSI